MGTQADCGHPVQAMRSKRPSGDYHQTHWCGWCADMEMARHEEQERCAKIAETTQFLGPHIDGEGDDYYTDIPSWARTGIAAAIRNQEAQCPTD